MENQEQFRDLKFEVAYSYCYEKIMYKFFGRLDKLASFILLLTGMSVVATAWSGLALGSIVAIVTSLQLIYTPGQRSQAAKDACRAYLSLYQSLNSMTAEQIRESLLSLNKLDTDEIGCLSHPARLAALTMVGLVPPKFAPERKMTKLENIASHFAGEKPEYTFSE